MKFKKHIDAYLLQDIKKKIHLPDGSYPIEA